MSPPQSGVRRWPLHPRPGALEALSSWLDRLARIYDLSVHDLLTHNLDLVGVTVPAMLDSDPPAALLAALAERTGLQPARLQAMTLAGQVPWLVDALHTPLVDAQEEFNTYVRANSVLLAPGEAGVHQVHRFATWQGVWLSGPSLARACPVCATDPDRGRSWVWQLPLVISCGEHGCRLGDAMEIHTARVLGEPPAPTPVDEPLATLDRYTYQALTDGRVELPARSVHVAVWFRLLRSLLDEVSLAGSTLSKPGGTTLQRIWRATGRPERGGLTVWRPYEHLTRPTQEAMLHAAATALHLAETGQITARGRLGSAIQPPGNQCVYDGDNPRRRRTRVSNFAAAFEEWSAAAHVDPEPARQMLRFLTVADASPANLAKQRHFLINQIWIPPEFLRLDLLPTPGRTAVETVTVLEREGFDPAAVRQAVGEYRAPAPVCAGSQPDKAEDRYTSHDLDQLRIQLAARLSQ